MQYLVRQFADIYGNAFNIPVEPEKRAEFMRPFLTTWAGALAARKFTRQHLRHGLKKCLDRGSPFPPNLAEFIGLCKLTEEDLGLPSVEEAYHEACCHQHGQPWSHPAVYHASIGIGYELNNWRRQDSLPLFKLRWGKIVARLQRGERLADIEVPKLLEQAVFEPLTREERFLIQNQVLAETGCPLMETLQDSLFEAVTAGRQASPREAKEALELMNQLRTKLGWPLQDSFPASELDKQKFKAFLKAQRRI